MSLAKSVGVITRALGIGVTANIAFSEDGLNLDGFKNLLTAIKEKDFSGGLSQTNGASEDLVADSTSTETGSISTGADSTEATETDSISTGADSTSTGADSTFEKVNNKNSSGTNTENQQPTAVKEVSNKPEPDQSEEAGNFNSEKALSALQDNENLNQLLIILALTLQN